MQETIGGLELPEKVKLAYGLVPFTTPGRKFGHNHDVGVTIEDIHPTGGLYPFPAAAETLGIVSDDANDTSLTGALTATLVAGGTDYVVGDIVTIVQAGGTGGTLVVATLGALDAIATFTVNSPGTGYSVAAATISGGSGNDDATITVDTVSANPNGARTVRIYGLDANYLQITEDVYLSGVTEVVTEQLFLRVNRAKVLTAGSSGSNEGELLIDNTTTGNVVVQIDALEGQTMQAIYTIPAGHEMVLDKLMGTAIGTGDAAFYLLVREEGGAWQQKSHVGVGAGGSLEKHYNGSDKFPEKTDVRVAANSSLASMEATAQFDFFLVLM
jgi:hypothetical protein